MSLQNFDVAGKRVFLRCDLNVPLKNGEITDDGRIRASLPTIKTLLANGASIVIAAHLGRPKGEAKPELSLAPVAKRLSELLGAPVVTTLMARGAFPDSHPQHLGMPGMHGTVAAVTALQKADLLITLGARFDDRVTGRLSDYLTDATIIHIDIDPAELNKNVPADVPIVADAKIALQALTKAIKKNTADEKAIRV